MSNNFRLIDIKTFKKVSSLFAGNYKTNFLGAGMEFDELRQYSFGDDVKNIDWLASAKNSKVFVKKYIEEREIELLFIIDTGTSMYFGFENKTKLEIAKEIFEILALSGIKNQNKIGVIFYNNKEIIDLKSKKTLQNFFLIKRKFDEIISKDSLATSNINKVLENLFKKQKRNSIIFIMSDYLDEINEIYFKALSNKNDLIFINTFDDFENNLDGKGFYNLVGNQKNIEINIENKDKKEKYINLRNEKISKFKKKIFSLGGSYLKTSNIDDIFSVLYKFFKLRK
ncbi:DUF58 domain-containing protein [Candidatus Gracilibacteria bacterium]|nr:DUF58 domain-containing protein [Candidatus Gracilibacteria bacterium]